MSYADSVQPGPMPFVDPLANYVSPNSSAPMIPALIAGGAALLGGALNLFGSSESNKTNLQLARENNRANMELAKYNWAQQKDMFDYSNRYNSPDAQMIRLKSAGLNPHLVYGNGAVGNTSGNIPTPATPTMNAGHVDPINYGQPIQALGPALLQAYEYMNRREATVQDNKLKETQAAAKRAEVTESTARVASIASQTAKTDQERDQAAKLFDYSLRAADLNNSQLELRLQTLGAELELYPLKRADLNSQVMLRESQYGLNMAQVQKINAEIRKISQEIRNLAAQENNLVLLGRKLGIEANIAEMTEAEQVGLIQESLTDAIIRNDVSALDYIDKSLTGTASGGARFWLQNLWRNSGSQYSKNTSAYGDHLYRRRRGYRSAGASGSW